MERSRARTARPPRALRSIATVLRRLAAGVLIGIGTIVGAKSEPDQHWSIPPTMVADGTAQDAADGGEGDLRHDTDDGPESLPACA